MRGKSMVYWVVKMEESTSNTKKKVSPQEHWNQKMWVSV